jgi:hypothetical protein
VQLSEKVVDVVRLAMVWLPEVALAPLHPPEAVQPVASVDDQVSCVLPPRVTAVGLAEKVTVGAAGGGGGGGDDAPSICTVVEREIRPPPPTHWSVKVVGLRRFAIVWLPEVDFVPFQPPAATHELAFVDDHVSVVLAPLATRVGRAARVNVGAAQLPLGQPGSGGRIATHTRSLPDAPLPEQVSVKDAAAARAAVCSEPWSALLPLQLPEAVHTVALVVAQLSVARVLLPTIVGRTLRSTVGAAPGDEVSVTVTEREAVPPALEHCNV